MMKQIYLRIIVLASMLIPVSLWSQSASASTTHITLETSGQFDLTFFDTSAVKTVRVKAHYDSNSGYTVTAISNADTAKHNDQTFDKNLNYYVFESQFNASIKSVFGLNRALTTTSVHQVYNMVWGLNHPGSDGSEAGILSFNPQILVLKEEDDEKYDAMDRKEVVDRMVSNKMVMANSDLEMAKQKVASLRENMIKVYKKDTALPANTLIGTMKKDDSANADTLSKLRDIKKSMESLITKYAPGGDTTKKGWQTALTKKPADKAFYGELNRRLSNLKVGAGKRNIADVMDRLEKSHTAIQSDADSLGAALVALEKAQHQQAAVQENLNQMGVYKIDQVEIQFERGFIERIKVWVDMKNNNYIFENIYAIGFSSTMNFKMLYSTRLYIRNSLDDDAPFIYLGDVFNNYDNRLSNFTRDYSPADTAFKISPGSTPSLVLHREKYINLIDAKVYTDLKGVNQNNPNGLFQIEASKRFNLNTVRYQIGGSRSDFGYFNSLELYGTYSKIEQNKRELTLRNSNILLNGVLNTPNYATTLDIMRYENYSAGLNLNGALFDKPDQKYSIYADLGLKYGHTLLADSVITPGNKIRNPFHNIDAHTVTLQIPKFTFELFAESRINIRLSYSLNYTMLFSNNAFKQVASYQKSDLNTFLTDHQSHWNNMYEAFVKLAPSHDRASHFFLRLRFYNQVGDMNTSFSQLQIGYAYNWSITR